MSKAEIIREWMQDNYHGQFQSIRAVWYAAKPHFQKHGISDKYATENIGKWLWNRFVDGDMSIYGDITNSTRVASNKLPILLFCEKNTLNPFRDLPEHIYANVYMASGQSNSYELANLILQLDGVDELYVYAVCDFDKSGDEIYTTLTSKLSKFFTLKSTRFTVQDIYKYETYKQPNGDDGLELDAIHDLQELVQHDLEAFLPYEMFEDVAIEDKMHSEYRKLVTKDEVLQELQAKIDNREHELWRVASNYDYNYCLPSDLYHLTDRVIVDTRQ